MLQYSNCSGSCRLQTFFPLIVVDISKESEKIASGVVDITTQCFFHKNVAARTKTCWLLTSDGYLEFKSKGTKANLMYQVVILREVAIRSQYITQSGKDSIVSTDFAPNQELDRLYDIAQQKFSIVFRILM